MKRLLVEKPLPKTKRKQKKHKPILSIEFDKNRVEHVFMFHYGIITLEKQKQKHTLIQIIKGDLRLSQDFLDPNLLA